MKKKRLGLNLACSVSRLRLARVGLKLLRRRWCNLDLQPNFWDFASFATLENFALSLTDWILATRDNCESSPRRTTQRGSATSLGSFRDSDSHFIFYSYRLASLRSLNPLEGFQEETRRSHCTFVSRVEPKLFSKQKLVAELRLGFFRKKEIKVVSTSILQQV